MAIKADLVRSLFHRYKGHTKANSSPMTGGTHSATGTGRKYPHGTNKRRVTRRLPWGAGDTPPTGQQKAAKPPASCGRQGWRQGGRLEEEEEEGMRAGWRPYPHQGMEGEGLERRDAAPCGEMAAGGCRVLRRGSGEV